MPSWPVALKMYDKLFLLWLGLGSFNKYFVANLNYVKVPAFYDMVETICHSNTSKYIQAYESQSQSSFIFQSVFRVHGSTGWKTKLWWRW